MAVKVTTKEVSNPEIHSLCRNMFSIIPSQCVHIMLYTFFFCTTFAFPPPITCLEKLCAGYMVCTTVACLPPSRGLEKCRVIGLVAWPAPFSQSQALKSVFLFPEEHGKLSLSHPQRDVH